MQKAGMETQERTKNMQRRKKGDENKSYSSYRHPIYIDEIIHYVEKETTSANVGGKNLAENKIGSSCLGNTI